MIGLRFYHREREWGAVFFNTDSRLSEEGRLRFCRQVTDMYLDKRRKMKFKGEGYEGHAKYAGYSVLEGIGGPRFLIDLETDHGKSAIDLMVLEQKVDASCN